MAASADLETVFPPVLIARFAGHGIALKDFVLQFLFSCVFVIMLVLQPVYGWLVSRFPRRVFLPAVYGFFIVTLLGFYVLFDSGVPGRGMAFFSGSLSSTCSRWRCSGASWPMCFPTRRHVLYGYIGAAGTVGAFLGPIITSALVQRVGIANLMLVSAGFLVVCLLCIWRLRHWAVLREREQQLVSGEKPMGGSVLDGLKLIVREPLLRWLAIMVVFGVGVGTLLYNQQASIVREAFNDAGAATAFFSRIDRR